MVLLHELRLGLWVQVDDLPPEQITWDTLKTLFQNPHHISKFNGVLITKKILERNGFKFYGYGGNANSEMYIKDNLIIYFDTLDNFFYFCYRRDEDGKKYGCRYRYVHQLQNFMLGLTGQETINYMIT